MRLRPGDIVVPIAWMCQIIGRNETLDSNYHVAWWPSKGTSPLAHVLGMVLSARARKLRTTGNIIHESFVIVKNIFGWVENRNLNLVFREGDSE